MNRSAFALLAAALPLAVAGCMDRKSSTQAFGRFQLVSQSWTVPGPCPKREYRHELVDPDGEVVLEWVESLGTTRDGAWSLWRGGRPTMLYAVDHKKDVLRPLPSAEITSPDWFRPGTQQLVLQSIRGSGDDVVVTDLADAAPNRTLLCQTQGHVERLAWSPDGSRLAVVEAYEERKTRDGIVPAGYRVTQVAWSNGKPKAAPMWSTEADVYALQWSASGRALALLEDRGPDHAARIRLLQVGRFDPPEAVAVEERACLPTDARVEWDGDVPRLRR